MSKKDEALKLALEALESGKNHGVAIDVLRRALAEQPAQKEPLSEEWIAHCWRKSMIGTRIHYVDYLALVRETERAHGIKENL